ncbi:SRPBCC family protein [Gordonia polyisoprenivorans]|uniref:SRPBCC family protein n=1 Tax=Gordonia polyisoprenivorans TaxID=84595 RepID=UPI001AD73F1A|nr:SRPBCC family protein [Gordonia polyisoprenivorans]QTI68728.1 SRPBCC family protein [Gordonia polyisoprenivorans]
MSANRAQPDTTDQPDTESMTVTRHVDAPPQAVFALLCDPVRHQETEPTDWVRDAIDTAPITRAGQIFAVNMFLEQAGGHYVIHNLVTAYEPDRVIAWLPGQLNDSGDHESGGWWWRYELSPDDDGTLVRLTYDWTNTPSAFREQVGGMPPFGRGFLEQSLASLDAALSRT